MRKSTKKIVDFFAVVGLEDATPHNPELEREKIVTNIDIVCGSLPVAFEYSRDQEKWIDFDGSQQLWLRLQYNQKNSPAITHLQFAYMPSDKDDTLKIPTKYDYLPVLVKQFHDEKMEMTFGGMVDNNNIFKGRFDLTKLLDADAKKGLFLVLCYKVESLKNFESPISDITIVVGEKPKKPFKGNQKKTDYQIYIPKDFKALTFSFGKPEKNRMICFKRKKNILQMAYSPKIIDKYPAENFPDPVSMFCFPEGIILSKSASIPETFSFILTQEDGARIYVTCLIFSETLPENLIAKFGHVDKSDNNKIFGKKALCLISHYPFMTEFREILKQLYRISLSKTDLPIERIICNLVNDLRVPTMKPGVYVGIQYEIGMMSFVFKPSLNIPYVSKESIVTLFRALELEKIIFLIECVLLEKKIILISKYKSIRTQISEALTGLIYPFAWNHVLIPILPDSLKSYVDAPVPFIIGLNSAHVGDPVGGGFSELIQVFLDNGDFIHMEDLPPLPEKLVKSLKKRLSVYEVIPKDKSLFENSDSAFSISLLEEDNLNQCIDAYEVRDAFYEFMSGLVKNYKKYMIVNPNNQSYDFCDVFKVKEFLSANDSQKPETFLAKFVETALFSFFIDKSNSPAYQKDYEFLNNTLKAKRTKKEPIVLKPISVISVVKCPGPSDINLLNAKDAPYSYESFPKLIYDLFIDFVPGSTEIQEEVNEIAFNNTIEKDLAKMDDVKWAKFLLENIYSIWYILFSIRATTEYNEQYSRMINSAIQLLDEMKTQNVQPSEVIFKCLIEACGFYERQDKLPQLLDYIKERKLDQTKMHGAYITGAAKGKKLKEKAGMQNFNEKLKEEEMQRREREILEAKAGDLEDSGMLGLSKEKTSLTTDSSRIEDESTNLEPGELSMSMMMKEDSRNESLNTLGDSNKKEATLSSSAKKEEVEGEHFSEGKPKERKSKMLSFKKTLEIDIPPLKIENSEDLEPEIVSQFEYIVFLLDERCPDCNKRLYPEEIISGWRKSYHDYITKCPFGDCSKRFVAKLKIKEVEESYEKVMPVEVFSPLVLEKELENVVTHDGESKIFDQSFEKNHRILFWNIIFYIKLINFPTFFLEKDLNKRFLVESITNLEKYLQSKAAGVKGKDLLSVTNSQKGKINMSPINSPTAKSPRLGAGNKSPFFSANTDNPLVVKSPRSQVEHESIKEEKMERENYAISSIKKVFGPLIKELVNTNKRVLAKADTLHVARKGVFSDIKVSEYK